MESQDVLSIRAWLEDQKVDGFYRSHKAALIRSCEPFGLMAEYKDEGGIEYHYLDGQLQAIVKGGKFIALPDH